MKAAIRNSSVLLCLLALPVYLQAAQVANYEFQNSLASTQVAANDLVDLGSGSYVSDSVMGQQCTVFSFAEQTGLSLDISGLFAGSNYTFVAVARLAETYDYAKVLDLHDRVLDEGLYAYENGLLFYDYDNLGLTQLSNDVWSQIVLVFDGSFLRGYVDGVLAFTEEDTETVGAITADTLYFFRDDLDTSDGENSSGRVANIQLYDEALSAEAVANLSFNCGDNSESGTPPPVPEPVNALPVPTMSAYARMILIVLFGLVSGVFIMRTKG